MTKAPRPVLWKTVLADAAPVEAVLEAEPVAEEVLEPEVLEALDEEALAEADSN
jgi:hypothetical protein